MKKLLDAERPRTPDHWQIEVSWGWGGVGPVSSMRFNETERFSIRNDREHPTDMVPQEKLDDELRRFMQRVVARFGFDCGRWTEPLCPSVYSIRIVPVFDTETIYLDEKWDRYMDLLIAERFVEIMDAYVADRRQARRAPQGANR